MEYDTDARYVLLHVLLALRFMIDQLPCCHTPEQVEEQCFFALTRLNTKFACTFCRQQDLSSTERQSVFKLIIGIIQRIKES